MPLTDLLESNPLIVERIPIPKLNDKEQKPFVEIIDQILSITKNHELVKIVDKKTEIGQLEKKIDQLFYKQYNLTQEEIRIIES